MALVTLICLFRWPALTFTRSAPLALILVGPAAAAAWPATPRAGAVTAARAATGRAAAVLAADARAAGAAVAGGPTARNPAAARRTAARRASFSMVPQITSPWAAAYPRY